MVILFHEYGLYKKNPKYSEKILIILNLMS